MEGKRNEGDTGDGDEEDERIEDEESIFQPRLRDLDKPEELHQFCIELKGQEYTETVRCHEIATSEGAVRFLLRRKGGGTFLAVLYPLDRVQAIEEELYDEDIWCLEGEYRNIPW